MRVKATVLDNDGKESTHDGIMRFAVVVKQFKEYKVVGLFPGIVGARMWQRTMYPVDSEVRPLVRDVGDHVAGSVAQRDDNLDLMKKYDARKPNA